MATIKSFTDLSQSKVLAEILPLESADMFYVAGKGEPIFIGNKMVAFGEDDYDALGEPDVLCWSLSALLGVLPKLHKLQHSENGYYCSLANYKYVTDAYDNPIDACYEMILNLHELKML